MVLPRLRPLLKRIPLGQWSHAVNPLNARTVITTKTGAILPKPVSPSFGLIRVLFVVVPGLLIGGTISKNFAYILEETELFIPSDDDDDDD
ncbi:DDDD domain containing protein [Asbolus verrucosus]|uniref:Essential MCU regulator, mitochondrial n=1 Tax=Asbolus verrucosus TaxID=1661398 RepID=A0A482VIH1_ASBVE|nr:DDDD domain containing protein [Asbolus verrucosus]